jgi:hypothetical protein
VDIFVNIVMWEYSVLANWIFVMTKFTSLSALSLLISRKFSFPLYIILVPIRDGILVCFFFLVSWAGVRLSPLGTSANIWPIVPAPDDR